MSDLYIVIPAAGQSRRYRDVGHPLKPKIWVKSKTGIIASMLHHVESTAPAGTLIAALPHGQKAPDDFHGHVFPIRETIGQADTVFQVARRLPETSKVLVLDCDMVLERKDIERLVGIVSVYSCAVAVTKTFDPNASRVDQVPEPTKFVEKEPISEWGMVGARVFNNAGELTKALAQILIREQIREPYLSEAIEHYPGKKFAYIISAFDDWGTPDRLKENGAEIIS